MSKPGVRNGESGVRPEPSWLLTPGSSTFSRNLSRFMLARLQALSSRCMYSEPGLEAVIGPVFVHVCQLCRSAGLAARLDRAGDGVGAAHERNRSGGKAARRHVLLRAAQPREVDSGA